MLLTTYLDPAAVDVQASKPGMVPEGAVIVKENYMPDKTLDALTVMLKESGYDPDHNDWFWAKFSAAGEIQVAGKALGCLACHGSVRFNDYVFTFPVAPIEP